MRQETSYYGLGLVMPGSPVATPVTNNKQLYNGGSEWQNDYGNLPDLQQTFYRSYDAALGRWIAVDPVEESAESMTVYQYAGNNPVMLNDPLGDLLLPEGSYIPQLAPSLEQSMREFDSNYQATQRWVDDINRERERGGSEGTNIYHAGDGTAADPASGMTFEGMVNFLNNAGSFSLKANTVTYIGRDGNVSYMPAGSKSSLVTQDNDNVWVFHDFSEASKRGQQDPHINFGFKTDPSSFNLKKIGNGYATQVFYEETWWYAKLATGRVSTHIQMNININVNIKGRLTPDGIIQKFSKPLAQVALASAFDNARKITYDEWQRGRVFDGQLMETFLENLNLSLNGPFLAPAYAAPVKPGGWNGVPMSTIKITGLFIFW